MLIKNICDTQLSDFPKCVVALGNFDGVHYAHAALVKKTRETAMSLSKTADENILTAVFTFTDLKKPFITTTDEKISILEKLGVDCVFLAPFDSVKDMSPESFVRNLLLEKLNCVHALCGYNYRFGRGASGDARLLKALCERFSVGCTVMPEIFGVSSTKIREMISEGKVEEASEALGHPFVISGKVVHGRGEGSSFGCPTLNIEIPDGKLLPKNGVYFTLCKVGDKIYSSVTNVGICPTFDKTTLTCENHLLDAYGDMYGENATVYFFVFRRAEQKFSATDELYKAVNADISAARDFHISHFL